MFWWIADTWTMHWSGKELFRPGMEGSRLIAADQTLAPWTLLTSMLPLKSP
jgi:hypothetical protein